jgi:integrase
LDLQDLDARTIDDYETWLRKEGSEEVDELSAKTRCDDLYLLRDLLDYLETINAVQPALSDAVKIPDLDENDGVRSDELQAERAKQILAYLDKYHYATLDHVIILLLAKTGRRLGGLHSLDCEHVYLNEDEPHIEFEHQPPGTRLKNKGDSEGHVTISADIAQVIEDYIEIHRPDVTDEHDRNPLLATKHGRIAKSTIRRTVYAWSRPCAINAGCPHDRDPAQCDAAQRRNSASKCPSSKYPHALRHGYITQCRRSGVPNVSPEVLEGHYDESTESDRREIRREVLQKYVDDEGGYL